MVLKGIKIQEQDLDTIYRELSKRGIEYRTVGDAFTKFIDLGLSGKLGNHPGEETPHPPGPGEEGYEELETPLEGGPQENAETVTEPDPDPGKKKEPGVVPMGPEILKGLKIDLEREASAIANNSVIRLYYAYARASRGYRGTLEEFVTDSVRDTIENRGPGKSAFLCFVEA